jgi:hypothetical protein
MKREILGRILITFAVTFFFGTFVAVLPLSTASSTMELLRNQNLNDNLSLFSWAFVRSFFVTTVSAYIWRLLTSSPALVLTATVLSIFAVLKSKLGVSALALSFTIPLIFDGWANWHYLECQCHPNFAGYVYLLPTVFVLCHIFLAFGSWFVLRPIWHKALPA